MTIYTNNRYPLYAVLLLTFCFITVSLSQQQKGTDNELRLKLDTDLTVLDAQVIGRKTGISISNLRDADFRLFEDGVKQEITYFSKDELPLSVILLIDFSGSVYKFFSDLRKSGALSLQGLKPNDELALMYFSSLAYMAKDFTTDHQLIEGLLLGKTTGDSIRPVIAQDGATGTHIADSIYQAAEQFHKSANPIGRRVIIVITDNIPAGSKTRFSEKEVTEQLYESGVTVYGIKIGSPLIRTVERYHPVLMLAKFFKDLGGDVNTYAYKTGGVVLDGRNHKAEEQLTKLIEMLRNRYSFGYTPSNPQMDGKFRKIKLKVSPEIEKREGGVVVLAKQGYYARKRNVDAKSAIDK